MRFLTTTAALGLAVSLAGCPPCPEGQSRQRVGWQTGATLQYTFKAEGLDDTWRCYVGTTSVPNAESNGWALLTEETVGRAQNLEGNKIRVVTSCDHQVGAVKMRWGEPRPDEIEGTAVPYDSGLIDAQGPLCVLSRAAVEVSVTVELYVASGQCVPLGQAPKDDLLGGVPRPRCAPPPVVVVPPSEKLVGCASTDGNGCSSLSCINPEPGCGCRLATDDAQCPDGPGACYQPIACD